MKGVVGETETSFIEGRQITYGIMIVNEAVSWAKCAKKQMLKVDFAKAFDSVSWNFLDCIFHQMNFGRKWRKWIKGCLKSARVLVLVNGSPTEEFTMERGLRQGDPLSPFLFILAAEALNVMIEEAVSQDLFWPVAVRNDNITLSHLQFVDDSTFYGEWFIENAKSLLAILQCFKMISGLKINYNKSKVFGVGVETEAVALLAGAIGCAAATLPFTYLGLPVDLNMSKRKSWDPVVHKIEKRLSN